MNNQERKKDKAAATGINPEVIKLDFNQLKDGLSGFVRVNRWGSAQRLAASGMSAMKAAGLVAAGVASGT